MRQRERLAKKRNEAFMKKKQLETQDTDIEASEDGLSDDFLGQGNGGDAESAEELASSRQDLDVDEGEVAKQVRAVGVWISHFFSPVSDARITFEVDG